MGWASGSDIASAVIGAVKKHVKDPKVRAKIYEPIIYALEDGDWDTQGEVEGEDKAFDKAMASIHPDWKNEED